MGPTPVAALVPDAASSILRLNLGLLMQCPCQKRPLCTAHCQRSVITEDCQSLTTARTSPPPTPVRRPLRHRSVKKSDASASARPRRLRQSRPRFGSDLSRATCLEHPL